MKTILVTKFFNHKPKTMLFQSANITGEFTKADESNNMAGMITVEASFLVPFLFFVVFAMLYVGLYFVERAKVYLICDEVLYYAAESIGKGSDLGNGRISVKILNNKPVYTISNSYVEEEKEIKKRMEQRFSGRLCLLELNQVEVKVTDKQIQTELSGSASNKFWQQFNIPFLSFTYQKKVQCAVYTDFIRKLEVYESKD